MTKKERKVSKMDIDKKLKKKASKTKYQAALSLLFYEGQIAWQINILFIGLNIGIGTIAGQSIQYLEKGSYFFAIASVIGIILNIAWLGTFQRNSRYYNFRMAQARNAEPQEWELLRKRGYDFSKGHEVIIDDEELTQVDKVHALTSFEKRYSNKKAVLWAIGLFIFSFLILLGVSIYYCFHNFCK